MPNGSTFSWKSATFVVWTKCKQFCIMTEGFCANSRWSRKRRRNDSHGTSPDRLTWMWKTRLCGLSNQRVTGQSLLRAHFLDFTLIDIDVDVKVTCGGSSCTCVHAVMRSIAQHEARAHAQGVVLSWEPKVKDIQHDVDRQRVAKSSSTWPLDTTAYFGFLMFGWGIPMSWCAWWFDDGHQITVFGKSQILCALLYWPWHCSKKKVFLLDCPWQTWKWFGNKQQTTKRDWFDDADVGDTHKHTHTHTHTVAFRDIETGR